MPHRKVRWRRLRRRSQPPGVADRSDRTSDQWYSHVLDFVDIPVFGNLSDLATAAVVIVGVLAAVALLWFLLIPALLVVVDVLTLILLVVAGLLAHVVLRSPWEVEASCGDHRVTWLIAGWRRSQQTIREVEVGVRSGCMPSGNVVKP